MALFKKLVGGGQKKEEVVIGAPQHFEKKTQETIDSLPEDLRKMLSASGISNDQQKKFPAQTVRALQAHAGILNGTSDARPSRTIRAQQARREALAKARSDKAIPGGSAHSAVPSPLSPRSASAPSLSDADLPLEDLVHSVLSEADALARYNGLAASSSTLRSEVATYGNEPVRVRRVPVASHASARASAKSDLLVLQGLGSHPAIAEYRSSHLVRNGDDVSLWLVTEAVDAEPLTEILEDQGGSLGMGVIAAILQAALLALEHVHSRDLVLQDLRVGGIYITADGRVKLLDVLPRPPGCFAYWLAPEAILINQLALKGDVWSVGVLAVWTVGLIDTHENLKAELLEGKAPYSDMQPAQAYLQISTEGRPPLQTVASSADQKQLKDFFEKCTQMEANDRPTEKDLLAHPFIKLAAAPAELARLVKQLRIARNKSMSSSGSSRKQMILIDEWPQSLLMVVAADLNVQAHSRIVRDAIPNATVAQLEKVCAHIEEAREAEVEREAMTYEARRQVLLTEMCRREVAACRNRYGTAIREVVREIDRRSLK